MCTCSIKMRYSVAHGRSQDGEGVNPTAALKCCVYVKLAVNNFTVQYNRARTSRELGAYVNSMD